MSSMSKPNHFQSNNCLQVHFQCQEQAVVMITLCDMVATPPGLHMLTTSFRGHSPLNLCQRIQQVLSQPLLKVRKHNVSLCSPIVIAGIKEWGTLYRLRYASTLYRNLQHLFKMSCSDKWTFRVLFRFQKMVEIL